MKKTGIAIVVVLLAAILLAGSCFTVFENEYACTVRCSNIGRGFFYREFPR